MGAFLGNQTGERDHQSRKRENQEVNCNLLAPLAQESTHVLCAKELDCLTINPFFPPTLKQEWYYLLQC